MSASCHTSLPPWAFLALHLTEWPLLLSPGALRNPVMLVVAEETTEPQSDAQIKVSSATTAPTSAVPHNYASSLPFQKIPAPQAGQSSEAVIPCQLLASSKGPLTLTLVISFVGFVHFRTHCCLRKSSVEKSGRDSCLFLFFPLLSFWDSKVAKML